MPLAGRMKLKNFLALAGVGAIGIGGLAWVFWPEPQPTKTLADHVEEANAARRDAPPPPVTSPPAERPASPEPFAVGEELTPERIQEIARQAVKDLETLPKEASPWPAERAVDRAIARFIGKPVSGGKKKDITSGQSAKVNIYMDDGYVSMNRAKVDLDRDERWDEKWTIAHDGSIQRKVAPQDDEDYSEVYVWDGAAWVPSS